MSEEWRPVSGYEGLYEVSDLGRVRSFYFTPPRIFVGRVDRYGYLTVLLTKARAEQRHKVHRLVCRAFHGPPPAGTEVGHLDGTKTNNAPGNLAWITRVEQQAHQKLHGKRRTPPPRLGVRRGAEKPNAKLSWEQVARLRERAASGLSTRSLAREFGINQSRVVRIKNGQSYGEAASPTPSIGSTQGDRDG